MKKTVFAILIVVFAIGIHKDNAPTIALSFLAIIGYTLYLIVATIKKWLTKGDAGKQKPISVTVKATGNTDYFCTIAGVQYHNSTQDIGGFLGYVCPEPTNQYDKNAIAVYRNGKKLIGYIPKDEQKSFREWSNKDFLPCIGFIKAGDNAPLYGKVKVIDCDPDETELEVIRFTKWLVSNFGVKFIPKGFNVNTDKELKTKKDWLEFLNSEIEKRESELYEES